MSYCVWLLPYHFPSENNKNVNEVNILAQLKLHWLARQDLSNKTLNENINPSEFIFKIFSKNLRMSRGYFVSLFDDYYTVVMNNFS